MLSMMMMQDGSGLRSSNERNDPNIDDFLFKGQYQNFYNPNDDSMEYFGSRNMQKAAAQSRALKTPKKGPAVKEDAKEDDDESGFRDRDGDYVDAKGRYQRSNQK